MNYLQRLKNISKGAAGSLPKGTKGSFVSSVSDPTATSQKISTQNALEEFISLIRLDAAGEHGRLLHRDAIRAALDAGTATELRDTAREFRQAWARAIAQRLCAPDRSSLEFFCRNTDSTAD